MKICDVLMRILAKTAGVVIGLYDEICTSKLYLSLDIVKHLHYKVENVLVIFISIAKKWGLNRLVPLATSISIQYYGVFVDFEALSIQNLEQNLTWWVV